MAKPLVVVYIPAYNEEGSIGQVISETKEYFSKIKDYDLKIIVVDDGSRDRTREIAEELKVDHIVSHPKNMGLGAALRSGLRQARDMNADVAVKTDADRQHIPEDIDKIVRPILEDKTDVCFGSRFVKKGVRYRMPLMRRMGNSFFSFLTSLFTGLKVTDGQTGLFAVNKRYLKLFRLTSNYNDTQQTIIDAWRNQLRYMEVPVIFLKRTSGKSFISLKYPFHVIPNIIRLFIHATPLKIFLPIGGFLILLSIVFLYMFFNHLGPGEDTIVLLFLSGLQIILFGLIADIISKKR